jgi:hypothetical protein
MVGRKRLSADAHVDLVAFAIDLHTLLGGARQTAHHYGER